MKTRPRGRASLGRKRAITRLASPDPSFDKDLRRAVRASQPGECVAVHAVECAMGDECTCVPVTLVVGAVA